MKLYQAKYLLVMSDEDGDSVKFLTEEELQNLLDDPLGYGVEWFIKSDEEIEEYVSRWEEGAAAIFKVEPRVPEIVTTAYRMPGG